MALIRPRLTDYHGIHRSQSELDFAIPFLDEDIPLYVDPFLLWKSPSQQDQALHTSATNAFNALNRLLHKGKEVEARSIIMRASECDEVGLGHSKSREGVRLGETKADEVLALFRDIREYGQFGFTHFEEIQLYIAGLSKDRISDICCSFLKSFLIDYTTQECEDNGVPVVDVEVPEVYSYARGDFDEKVKARLPVTPASGKPVVFVPKRWLRFGPWISFDDYFRTACPRDEIHGGDGSDSGHVKVLRFNRDNYDLVRGYVEAKERAQQDCKNDPLFSQVPVSSAKATWAAVKKLPSGKIGGADRKYEDGISRLLASLLYPHLDFAQEQSRTDSGALIRDLIFYNNCEIPFLKDIHDEYGNRQLVFEMKNVAAVDRDHLNQVNRYLDGGIGKFGVIVTRKPLSRAMFKNTIDLWSGQRRCIIVLTDADIDLMVTTFASKQRDPIDVLKKKYVEFRRACPS